MKSTRPSASLEVRDWIDVRKKGAEPGDVLEIRFLEIEVIEDFAINLFRPGGGALPERFPYQGTRVIPLDLERNVAVLSPGIEIPLRPFFGSVGVAPPLATGRIGSGPPGFHTGNIDHKELVAGESRRSIAARHPRS